MGLGMSFSPTKHQSSLIVTDDFLTAKLVVFPAQNQGMLYYNYFTCHGLATTKNWWEWSRHPLKLVHGKASPKPSTLQYFVYDILNNGV